MLKDFGTRLESAIRAALAENNQDRITKIVWQLCHEYAYAVHQPHARNGGLIGLAAAAIALGAVSIMINRFVDDFTNPRAAGSRSSSEGDSTARLGLFQ